MRLAEFLRPQHVVAPLASRSAHEAVRELARVLVDTGFVPRPERLAALWSEPRVRDLIHVGDRVLLPHLRTDAVDALVVALGVAPEPLRENGCDGTAHVVVLVLAPPSAAGLYLQTMAALARALRQDAVVERMLAARSAADVLAIPEVQGITIHPRLTVRDVMSHRAYRVSPDAPVAEALELIAAHRLRAIPVVGEGREVLGMVSDRDLLRHLLPGVSPTGEGADAAALSALRGKTVRDIMTRSVICVPEDQAIAEVAAMMVAKDLERLPVTAEGKLTGFLTRGDIIRKMFG